MELVPTPQRPAAPRRRRRFLRALALGALLATAGLLLAPLALGLDHTIVRDREMGTWRWDGSLALADTVPAADLRVGDVITFVPPGAYAARGTLTRRVVAIDGWSALTRGDESVLADPWRLDLDEGSFSRLEVRVPLLGRLFLGRTPWWLGGGAAALLALALLRRTRAVLAPLAPLAPVGEVLRHEPVGARHVV